MSLRTIHILFILTALGLLAFVAYWAGHMLSHGHNGASTGLLVVSCAGLIAGVPYLGWFVKKTKTL